MSDVFFTRTGKLAARKVADGRTPLDTVVRTVICREFDVDPETALRDASEFLAALTEQGILRTSDQPLPSTDPAPPAGSRA
jgi:Coenzyme PQQ synthesis protein D (PqqD)